MAAAHAVAASQAGAGGARATSGAGTAGDGDQTTSGAGTAQGAAASSSSTGGGAAPAVPKTIDGFASESSDSRRRAGQRKRWPPVAINAMGLWLGRRFDVSCIGRPELD